MTPRCKKFLLQLTPLVLLVVSMVIFTGCGEEVVSGSDGRVQTVGATKGIAESGNREVLKEVDRMSVREKVGQMFVVSVTGTESDYYIEKMVRERNIGGVLLFGYNMESEAQTRSLVDSLQGLAMETGPAVPLFVAVDHEGGKIASAPWIEPLPAAAELGERGDPEEVRRIAEEIGTELRGAGVNTNFAPVVDTGFGAAIETRSYGEDPSLVSRMSAAAVEGFEAADIVSTAKHFPNHGVAAVDSHVGFPVVEHDMSKVRAYDLPPFRAAIEAGVPMVMMGHLIYPAIDPERPASLSPHAVRLLREELGFDGVIVSDDLSMAGASGEGTVSDAAVAAVKAGVDLLIISGAAQEQADAYEAVVAAIEAGEIPEERITRSVRRVVGIKNNYPIYGEL